MLNEARGRRRGPRYRVKRRPHHMRRGVIRRLRPVRHRVIRPRPRRRRLVIHRRRRMRPPRRRVRHHRRHIPHRMPHRPRRRPPHTHRRIHREPEHSAPDDTRCRSPLRPRAARCTAERATCPTPHQKPHDDGAGGGEGDGAGGGGGAHAVQPVVSATRICPDGSVPLKGLSPAYANGPAAAESPTGLTFTVSLEVNWPAAGSYQRAAMFTRPFAGSVHPDWNPR